MEPLNQNWGALPGTVLESGPGPIEVGFKRLGPELELLKQQEKAKIEATKEKAAKAAEAMKLPDYTPVGIPHQGVYANMQNQFMKEQAELERMYQQNPLDSRNDVGNPFSEAGMKRQAGIRRIQDYAAASAEKQKAYYEFLKGAEGKEINPLDMKRMKDWYERSPDITNDGEVVIDPMPVLIGNFDKSTYYTEIVKEAKPDITASSGPSGKGYIFDSATTKLTPEDIRGMANSAASDYSSNVLFAFLTEEMNNAKESNPKEYERIAAEAKKANVSWQQQKAYEDMIPLAYEQQKKETKSDATFNNKMGSGWGKDEEGVDRFLRKGASIAKGDPETMKPFDRRTANVPDFVLRALPEDGEVTFTNEYNGVMLTPLADKTPVVINGVYRHGNMIYIDRRKAGQEGKLRSSYPGKDPETGKVKTADSLPVLQMTNEEFLTGIVEEVAGGNKDLNREIIYRRAKDLGMLNEQGTIDPWKGQQKPGAADLILAPTSKKGMMN